MVLMPKFLPLIFVALFILTAFFYIPARRDILYSLQNNVFHQSFKLTDDLSQSCVDVNQVSDATGAFDDSAKLAVFNGSSVDYPKTSLASINQQTDVLGAVDSNGQEKWVEVELNTQTLRAWEGNQLVRQFPISSGLWFPTPPGTYEIYWKIRYIRMRGGSSDLGTYYDLPNVPDTMFFYQGYALHGAYWHNNFGHPMSHGCVNEPLADAHWLFEWAGPQMNPDQNSVRSTPDNPGSRVFIH